MQVKSVGKCMNIMYICVYVCIIYRVSYREGGVYLGSAGIILPGAPKKFGLTRNTIFSNSWWGDLSFPPPIY